LRRQSSFFLSFQHINKVRTKTRWIYIKQDLPIWTKPRIAIVSDRLLTGFDAPDLWALFLYKPLKEHGLLPAVARTNRPFIEAKEFELDVYYVGVADNLEKAIQQFEGRL
jgi:type I restriction enzyme, R subunit